jgi:hypothetical protein
MSKFMEVLRIFHDRTGSIWIPVGYEITAVQILRQMFGHDLFTFRTSGTSATQVQASDLPTPGVIWKVYSEEEYTGICCVFRYQKE